MASLKLAIAVLGMSLAVPAQPRGVATWRPYIGQASQRFGVPEHWIEQVMRAESGGQTTLGGRPIRSRAGAIGLMQLMPATWDAMRRALALGNDPDDPRDNVLAGTFYLRMMYDRFGYPGLFAAYNAGPGRYAASLATGQTLPGETIAYLQKVGGAGSETRGTPSETLFAVKRDSVSKPPRRSTDRSDAPLFAVRNNVP